ncbi:MAG: DUF1501 domain-containing protein [Actinomycetia bacterium]|nr:DUF1501 domain-containing protein [Actinomycetes bacterium]
MTNTAITPVKAATPATRRGLSRRHFLAGTGTAGVAGIVLPSMRARYAFATPEDPAKGDVLVVIFLRGGADGLNLAAPFAYQSYKDLRPGIRIKEPGEAPVDPGGAPTDALVLNSGGGQAFPSGLDGVLGMNPGMVNLYNTAWANGDLALVHAAGLPRYESRTRSHFDAEQYWERGSANLTIRTGWLARHLSRVPTDRLAAVGRRSRLQESLRGPSPAMAMSRISNFGISGFSDGAAAATALAGLYSGGSGDPLVEQGFQTLSAVGIVGGIDTNDPGLAPQNGAVYPDGSWGRDLSETAMLIRSNVGLQTVAIDRGGWDTHSNMEMPEQLDGNFRGRAAALADGLAAFHTDLGPLMNEVTVVVMSEFGRTINENGSGGTDHGRGGLTMAMGANVNGGVYGDFVDTIADDPNDGDLSVLNDYRTVLAEILQTRCADGDVQGVFPTWAPQPLLGLVS